MAEQLLTGEINETRCTTGVPGLDHIICGGLPSGHVYLLEGDPGTGKTTIALQFVAEGLRNQEKVLYVTLSESPQELQSLAYMGFLLKAPKSWN